MPPDVSVVVPVWNPGPNLRRCTDSLLAQTMPRDRFEIVLVDDGSSDGTADTLDQLAAQFPDLIRVIHIPNSGWPGRPRNVGIDAARGEFVHLVDNDDILPAYTLQTLAADGRNNDADVIMGRPTSDFRGLVHSIYREPFWCGPLRERPELTTTLTPHKMFRRSMLVRHGIHFPEGPAPLEDQQFVMKAYLHARLIAVRSDRVHYRYLRRVGSGRNAGDQAIDAAQQARAVAQVLDIIDEAVEPSPFRDRLYRRFYGINLLSRLNDGTFVDADTVGRTAMLNETRQLVEQRFGPGVTDGVGAAHRVIGRLVRDRDIEGLLTAAELYGAVGLHVEARDVAWRRGVLHLDIDGAVAARGVDLHCEATPDGWALPAQVAPGVPVHDRLLDDSRDEPDVEISLVSRADASSFATDADVALHVAPDGCLRVTGHVNIDPVRALAGQPVPDGLWDLRGRLRFGGWNRACPVRVPGGLPKAPVAGPCISLDGRAVVCTVTSADGPMMLDVNQWATTLATTLAAGARLEITPRRGLALSVQLGSATSSLPRVEVLLQRTSAGDGSGVVALTGQLRATGAGAAEAHVRLPRLLPPGRWQAWLRLPDGPARAAARMPWTVTAAGKQVIAAATFDQPDSADQPN